MLPSLRVLAALLSLSTCANAGSFSIDLVQTVKALHAKTPASTKLLILTGLAVEGLNATDWYQTVRYAGPGGGGCEQNKVFTTGPCALNVPKFRAFKAAMAIGIAAEAVPHLHHFDRINLDQWDKIGLMINVPLIGIYTGLTIHNAASIRQINGR